MIFFMNLLVFGVNKPIPIVIKREFFYIIIFFHINIITSVTALITKYLNLYSSA